MDITSYILGRKSSGGGAGALKYLVVDELPQVGEDNTIYLVPKSTSKTNNYYDEYMYIENEWELIGDTEIDLSDYQKTIQYAVVPNATADNLGKIIQYIGTTTASYTNGYYYQCVSDGQDPATYSWSNINVQTQPDLSNYLAKDNTTAFTPTGDYQPATKKYVDDNAGSVYFIKDMSDLTSSGELWQTAQQIINDFNNNKYSIIYKVGNPSVYGAAVTRNFGTYDYNQYDGILTLVKQNEQYYRLQSYGAIISTALMSVSYIRGASMYTMIRVNSQNEIISIQRPDSMQESTAVTEFLMTNVNYSTPYTPRYPGSPANKKYVDDTTLLKAYQLAGLSEYSSSSTYAVGDYVYYNNLIYKCSTAVSTAEAFDDTKWTQKTYMEYMSDTLVGTALQGSY